MAAPIPGYYYDEERRRYFKMEKSQTAPASAPWSSEAIKKRKADDAAHQAARQRAHMVQKHIKRHGLGVDVVTSGLLARQTGRARAGDADLAAAAWAAGVVDKGRIPLVASLSAGRLPNIPCLYVGGEDDKTGLGVAYATLDEETLVASYISTDESGRVTLDRDRPGTLARGPPLHSEMIRCRQMSSIKYHKPSHKMLLTSREPDDSCGLYVFSPPVSAAHDSRPHWLLGQADCYQRLSIRRRPRDRWLVHQSTPAPPSSELLCVMGTNAGILPVPSSETTAWSAPRSAKGRSGRVPLDILGQDFQQSNHNVLLAGGRQPRLWTMDLRTPESEWASVRHASSIAHVRSVNPHQVLVAGLESTMALYDMRYMAQRPNGPRPLVRFPAYRNAAHVHTGWDVSTDLGLVAAAHDDGTLRLFSLRSGKALRSAALDAIRSETPLRALMFQRMPAERAPSLFVGEGPSLNKYSFGALHGDDEA